ncbi:MAG: cysteine desulfurase [Gemmatimonadota bacterium]|nr:cysteine desulfurase [Gemmatimonadota bacterium]
MDPVAIRRDFPILEQQINGHALAYLDNAATSQKPTAVLAVLDQYYRRDNANVHRGIHELSRRATSAFEDARSRVGRFVGANDPGEVIFTRGTTEAINLMAHGWGLEFLNEGDEILLTTMEHHSNVVPWQLVARRTGAVLKWLELDDEGRLRLEALDRTVNSRTRLVSLTHVSNALGTVNPVADIVRAVRYRSEAVVLIDGAQAVPHLPVDVAALDCDAYAFSGHKMCGPTGIGVLWARRSLLDAMPPFQGGGEMIRIVRRESSTWADLPHKFEAGTPDIAGAIGLGTAVQYLEGIGMSRIARHEREVLHYALDRMSTVRDLRIFGPSDPCERSGVISFTLSDAHPHDIATILDAEGIAIRAGHHCAQLVMRHFGVAATARASFYFYNTTEDVDRLVEGLETVRTVFA